MTTTKADKLSHKLLKRTQNDFSKVGGLSNHIKILRDTIIVPLLHNNVYSHFNIKTPRGVLFYGPPGTGKTLVAGALATELDKEGFGKVSFYQRKGADVLDKWVGESEKKLRTLFENATKNRPSIIFFDELDGLAPIRSTKNDHVHCSIVTTLLALMDGLDSVPGVIVIGATNRIESVDPALRRSGRFDREIYFPLPSTEARKEILQVHVQTWRHKPSQQFLTLLAEMTTGFCGSDLQAFCAEALLCAMKRHFPNIQKCLLGNRVKVEASELKIEECDFMNARKNLIPSSQKLGTGIRKLSPTVAPLLQRQLNVILSRIKTMWPHFFVQFYKYLIGSERYIGRVVLIGSSLQGVSTHLVPAILQHLEHLPALFLNEDTWQNRKLLPNYCKNLPSILVMSKADELWSFLDVGEQNYVVSMLENIHAGLPILIITTYEEDLPLALQNFFYNNTSLVIDVENPMEQEVETFFMPLFFGSSSNSLSSILSNHKDQKMEKRAYKAQERTCGNSSKVYNLNQSGGISKSRSNLALKPIKIFEHAKFFNKDRERRLDFSSKAEPKNCANSLCTLCGSAEKKKRLSLILTEVLAKNTRKSKSQMADSSVRNLNLLQTYGDSSDVDKQKIYSLWRRTVFRAARDMPVAHLEVLYDTIAACINVHKENFHCLAKNLEETLADVEQV